MQGVRELIAPARLLDDISEDEFRRLMHEETIVVEYEAEQAKRALPRLITSAADRRHAHELLDGIRTHFKLEDRQLRSARRDPHAAAGSGESEWRAGAAAEARDGEAGGEADCAPYECKDCRLTRWSAAISRTEGWTRSTSA